MNVTIAIIAALVLGVGVPWLGVRMLVPTLEQTPATVNYRGRPVFLGLGVAWLLWAGAAIVGGIGISRVLGEDVTVVGLLTMAGPLALVAFVLGLIDDAYGSSESRGFRGHLGALARGRMTTGGLKLIGISAASLFLGFVVGQIAPWGVGGEHSDAVSFVMSVVGGAAIALTSNIVNLMDLRPGRAIKVYSLFAACAAASSAVLLPWLSSSAPAQAEHVWSRVVDLAVLLLFMFGPVVAVYRYDLGERGMLGDAGANPMGAVAGMLIVVGLPLWGLAVYAVLMFALNLASERVSFSRVIESAPALRWIDGLGRLPAEESSAGET